MGIGLVIVEKDVDGEVWSNSYPFARTANQGALQSGDLDAIGMNVALTDAGTNPGDASFLPLTGLLVPAIIGFERLLMPSFVQMSRVYVSDGLQNSGGGQIPGIGNMFAVQQLSFNGLRTGLTAADCMPLNVSLRIARVPSGYGVKESSLWLRAVLLDGGVKLGARGGVTFTDDVQRASYATLLATSIANSGLNRFFGEGANDVFTGIAHYLSGIQVPPNDPGDLYQIEPVSGYKVVGPTSRQVKRGRKRTP